MCRQWRWGSGKWRSATEQHSGPGLLTDGVCVPCSPHGECEQKEIHLILLLLVGWELLTVTMLTQTLSSSIACFLETAETHGTSCPMQMSCQAVRGSLYHPIPIALTDPGPTPLPHTVAEILGSGCLVFEMFGCFWLPCSWMYGMSHVYLVPTEARRRHRIP